jgi:glycosyltransferase involved in cell wall biosynthesis
MLRKKILWLASWYPNRNDPFDGDFIQRHARAAAIDHDVHVIFVGEAEIENAGEEENKQATGLAEQYIYFKKRNGPFANIRRHWVWQKTFREAIGKYISRNGLPHCVHVQVPWKAGLMGLWMKKKYGIPFVLTEHWGIYHPAAPDPFHSKPALQQRWMRDIFREAGALFTVSQFLAGSIEKEISRKTDAVLPNVVDTTLFFSKEEKYSRFTFLHVSNMVPLKNVDLILRAFQEFLEKEVNSDAQLLLVGNRNDGYVKMAEAMGLLNQSVFFRGEVSYGEVADEMHRSHCFLIPSDSETFSCVTAEALCSGLPVIASESGALPELVNGSNGILVPAKDQQALTDAMLLVWKDFGKFDRGHIAREASQQYGYSEIAARFRALYGSFCQNSTGA